MLSSLGERVGQPAPPRLSLHSSMEAVCSQFDCLDSLDFSLNPAAEMASEGLNMNTYRTAPHSACTNRTAGDQHAYSHCTNGATGDEQPNSPGTETDQ